VREGVNDDDPDARHFWFGDAHGTAGTLVSFMEYPGMDDGRAGLLAVAVVLLAALRGWERARSSWSLPARRATTRAARGQWGGGEITGAPRRAVRAVPHGEKNDPRRRVFSGP
jgi:catechol 2,3-dioxygenase-like lactoylglutathione lyase family enzyme